MNLIKTKLNGLDFYYDKRDKFVGARIALGKYEEYETQLILENVNSESVVIDVGANIGYYTLLLAQKAKMVYAFEPEKKCFEILKKNIKANNIKNVIAINKAVGEVKEQRYLIKDKRNMGNSRINPSKSPLDKGDLISCVKLDDSIKNQKVDLMKIDTQGYETEVVMGARDLIKKNKPVIFVEYNPDEYKDDSMIKFLKSIYKTIWQIDYWFYIYRKVGKKIMVDPKTGYTNLWMKRQNSWIDCLRGYKNVEIKKVIKSFISKH